MSKIITYSPTGGEYLLQPLGIVLLTIVLINVLFLGAFLFSKRENKKTPTLQIIFSGIAMALALLTSYIKFASLPFGGSITLFSMFFICLIGYLFGLKAGLSVGVAYGILQLITQPYIYHPLQVLLDYPIAFGLLGLSGLFKQHKRGLLIGYLVGVFGRYLAHCISGYIFFAEYAPEGTPALLYTLGYNSTYILPEAIITAIVLAIPAVTAALLHIRKPIDE